MSRSHLLLIGGRSGVGKSTVAGEIHRQLSELNVQHAWIEGDNLDMAHPMPWRQGHMLAEANLAAMWANYRAVGHRRLIYVNTASIVPSVVQELTSAMGDDPRVTGVLLTSADATAEHRLRQREVGGGFDHAFHRSREAAHNLEVEASPGITRLTTDGRSVSDIADDVIQLTGWASS